tara:strand:+ start:720 stop:947 length:228 start_codon:yes stop_codon:yes gene_type:complete
LEHVQNLEVLFVESSLDLVLVIWEFTQLSLVRLADKGDEESSGESEQELLNDKHGSHEQENQEKHEFLIAISFKK